MAWRANWASIRGPNARSPTRSAATPRPIDVGEIDGRLFVNIAGIGIDAHVASRFNAPGNGVEGLLGYVAHHRPRAGRLCAGDYRITTARRHASTFARVLVDVANSAQFGNGARIAPGARVDDGVLDLVVVEERSRSPTFCQRAAVVHRLGGPDSPAARSRASARPRSKRTEPMIFHVDGEPVRAARAARARASGCAVA